MTDSETVLAAERDVIGAMLTDPNTIRGVAELITHEDFLAPRHAAAHRAIVRRWVAQEPISEALVAQEVTQAGIRGLSAVDLFDMRAACSPGEARPHAHLIQEASTCRRVDVFAVRLRQAVAQGLSAAEVMTLARGEFEAVQRSASAEMEAITLGELLAGTDEYDWIVPGLLEREDRLMITGAEGGGKTTLGRQIVIMAASGLNPMTAESIEPVRVQVIDCENTDRQWRRKVRGVTAQAKRLGTANPEEVVSLALPGRIDLASERWLGAVHRLLDASKPDLLYIGPLYKLAPGALNTDDDAARVLNALDSIRDRGIAMIIEAHAGHAMSGDGGQRNLRPRGSSQFLGWPEMGFGLRLDKDNPDISVIERWRGDRDERSWPEKVRRGGDFPWTPVQTLQGDVNKLDWTEQEATG